MSFLPPHTALAVSTQQVKRPYSGFELRSTKAGLSATKGSVIAVTESVENWGVVAPFLAESCVSDHFSFLQQGLSRSPQWGQVFRVVLGGKSDRFKTALHFRQVVAASSGSTPKFIRVIFHIPYG